MCSLPQNGGISGDLWINLVNSKPLEGIHPTAKCAPQCPFRTSDVGHLTRDEFGAHGRRAVFEPKLMPRVPNMILADLRDDTSKDLVGNWLASMPNWRVSQLTLVNYQMPFG